MTDFGGPFIWHPFTVAMWNPGERIQGRTWVAGYIEDMFDAFSVDVWVYIEAADQIRDVLLPLAKAGYPVLLGPDKTPDGRKIALLFDPEKVEPVGDPIHWHTDVAFIGRRRGRKVRMGHRWKIGHEFRHFSSGRTPIVVGGHEVPTQSNPVHAFHAHQSTARTRAQLEATRGAVFLGEDWNNRRTSGPYKPIRDLEGWTDDMKRFGEAPTFNGRTPIDRWVWRDIPSVHVAGVHRIQPPGKEKGIRGGVGHKVIVLRTTLGTRMFPPQS